MRFWGLGFDIRDFNISGQDFRLGGIYAFKISAFGVVIDTEFLGEDFT